MGCLFPVPLTELLKFGTPILCKYVLINSLLSKIDHEIQPELKSLITKELCLNPTWIVLSLMACLLRIFAEIRKLKILHLRHGPNDNNLDLLLLCIVVYFF